MMGIQLTLISMQLLANQDIKSVITPPFDTTELYLEY
jgi:hypothetical protein